MHANGSVNVNIEPIILSAQPKWEVQQHHAFGSQYSSLSFSPLLFQIPNFSPQHRNEERNCRQLTTCPQTVTKTSKRPNKNVKPKERTRIRKREQCRLRLILQPEAAGGAVLRDLFELHHLRGNGMGWIEMIRGFDEIRARGLIENGVPGKTHK